MRSRSRLLLYFSLAGAWLVIAALAAFAFASPAQAAATSVGGAIGGSWQTIDARPLAGQRITALLTDPRGVLWVGTEERGLASWDGQTWRSYGSADRLPDNRIVAAFADREGRLWASTGTGLGYLPAGGGPFRRIGLSGLRTLPILAFAQTADGSILLGGIAGLQTWQADGALEQAPELNGQRVLALKVDSNGVAWAGTTAGLWHGEGGSWQRESRVGDGPIAALYESSDGPLYAAGRDAAGRPALWRLRAGTWQEVRTAAHGETTGMVDLNGTLWLGGTQGIVAGQGEIWESYDPGLLPSASVTALALSEDGQLWIGTINGLAAHRPDSAAPKITIKRVDGVGPENGVVQLDGDRVEGIELAAEDQLIASDRLHIFTRLEGIDQAPRLLTADEVGDLRAVNVYAGQRLPPGSHVLRAWAQDDAFNRSPEAQVRITVPELAYGPAGLAVRRDTALAGLAGLALVLAAGAATGATVRTRRRHAARAAEASAARIRAVADRSGELYAQPVPLRTQEVQEIVAALPAQSVLLLGDQGMGKTALLALLADELSRGDDRSTLYAPAVLDLTTVPHQQLFHALMRSANEACQPLIVGARPRLRWSEDRAVAYGEQEFSADLGTLLAWLQPQLARRFVLVFLLDNVESLDGYLSSLRDGFRRLVVGGSGAAASPTKSAVRGAAPAFRLVMAAKATPGIVEGITDLFHSVVLKPVSRTAAAQLLGEGTRGMLAWEPEAERAAVGRAEGNPGTLVSLGRAASLAALSDSRLRIAVSDVP